MSIKSRLAAAVLCALGGSTFALAQDHSFSEGPILTVSSIRTVDGHFDDYMKWLDTVWKAEGEAAKKAGYIIDYAVYTVDPRGPDDADVLLVIEYKNWAALDNGMAKQDAVLKMIEGSVQQANQSEADRSKIRRVLGTQTMQQALLK